MTNTHYGFFFIGTILIFIPNCIHCWTETCYTWNIALDSSDYWNSSCHQRKFHFAFFVFTLHWGKKNSPVCIFLFFYILIVTCQHHWLPLLSNVSHDFLYQHLHPPQWLSFHLFTTCWNVILLAWKWFTAPPPSPLTRQILMMPQQWILITVTPSIHLCGNYKLSVNTIMPTSPP